MGQLSACTWRSNSCPACSLKLIKFCLLFKRSTIPSTDGVCWQPNVLDKYRELWAPLWWYIVPRLSPHLLPILDTLRTFLLALQNGGFSMFLAFSKTILAVYMFLMVMQMWPLCMLPVTSVALENFKKAVLYVLKNIQARTTRKLVLPVYVSLNSIVNFELSSISRMRVLSGRCSFAF